MIGASGYPINSCGAVAKVAHPIEITWHFTVPSAAHRVLMSKIPHWPIVGLVGSEQ